jgi:hypothetical protein
MKTRTRHERRREQQTGTGECTLQGRGRAISDCQLLPKPRLTWTAKAKQSQRSSSVPSFLPPVVLDHSKVFFPSFLSFLFSLFFCQMTDSYVSSRAGDLSPNSNGSALNGSSPSLSNNLHAINPIIRKKLMGYVGFANLPNQVHRKSVRKGFQFTVMVVGASYHNTDFAPRSSHLYPQASRAWESRPWLTLSSTPPFIPPRNLPLRMLNDPRPLPSRALVPVITLCLRPWSIRHPDHVYSFRHRGEWCPSSPYCR